MMLTPEDRAALMAIIREEFGEDRTDLHAISSYDERLFSAALAAGMELEREACAKALEDEAGTTKSDLGYEWIIACVRVIRARGQATPPREAL